MRVAGVACLGNNQSDEVEVVSRGEEFETVFEV